MATPLKIKRSAVSNKRPTISDLQLGELALNTYDGYLFAERDTGGVGIGTTVVLLTPWIENFGGQSIYYSNSVGIGTTNATSKLTVTGDALISGVVTATTFIGNLTGTASSTTNIPNLTGAITSVNTTTSLGSFTSSQLATALTDETGSGANVFATSPTLVTPVLGAATATNLVVGSGVTINSSGINASGIITATYYYGNGSNLAGIATTKNLTVGTRTTAVSISVVGTGMTVSLRSGIGTVNF